MNSITTQSRETFLFSVTEPPKPGAVGGDTFPVALGIPTPRASPGILQVNHEQKDRKVRPPEVRINQVKPERGEWVSEMDEEVGGPGGGAQAGLALGTGQAESPAVYLPTIWDPPVFENRMTRKRCFSDPTMSLGRHADISTGGTAAEKTRRTRSGKIAEIGTLLLGGNRFAGFHSRY